MSSILDALRKSEAERSRGTIPELTSGPVALIKKNKTHRWLYFALGGTLVFNLSALLFWSGQLERTGLVGGEPSSDQLEMPKRETEPPLLPKAGAAQTEGVRETIPLHTQEAPFEVVQIPSSSWSETSSIQDPESNSSLDDESQEEVILPSGVQEAMHESETGLITSQSPEKQTPFLDTLPAEFKRQIPSMVFNSHIFSKRPGSSRVMINNVYLREGEFYQSLKILYISEQGVTFEKQGQVFQVSVLSNWSFQ